MENRRQTNIKNFFKPKVSESEIKENENVKIKEEPPVEFVLILPSLEVDVENLQDGCNIKVEEEEKHQCPKCPKWFRTDAFMKRHLGRAHVPKKKCKICSKEVRELSYHMKTHQQKNLKNLKCDHCPERFWHKGNLITHVRIHRKFKEKLYVCKVCKEEFKSYNMFKRHENVHTDDLRPFKCDFCLKDFPTKNLIRSHIISQHMKQNKFKCSYCEYQTFNINKFQYHQKTHNNKRYPCTICNVVFMTSQYFKIHNENVHATSKDFECELCGREFTSNRYLKRHLDFYHGEF